jgi:hypothetical protein
MRTSPSLIRKIKNVLDEKNEFKHVPDEDFDLRFVLEKLGIEVP